MAALSKDWRKIPCFYGSNVYNLEGDGFRISFNDNTVPNPFGAGPPEGETTLVIGDDDEDGPTHLILNGDWRIDYQPLARMGLDACRAFYEHKKATHRSAFSED